ncbi:unnamed protein product, partial [Brassica oleracea var. botrytis]
LDKRCLDGKVFPKNESLRLVDHPGSNTTRPQSFLVPCGDGSLGTNSPPTSSSDNYRRRLQNGTGQAQRYDMPSSNRDH